MLSFIQVDLKKKFTYKYITSNKQLYSELRTDVISRSLKGLVQQNTYVTTYEKNTVTETKTPFE